MATKIMVTEIELRCDHEGCGAGVSRHDTPAKPKREWATWWNGKRNEGWVLEVMGDGNYCLCPTHNPYRNKG